MIPGDGESRGLQRSGKRPPFLDITILMFGSRKAEPDSLPLSLPGKRLQ
jgi:hypothetical protein